MGSVLVDFVFDSDERPFVLREFGRSTCHRMTVMDLFELQQQIARALQEYDDSLARHNFLRGQPWTT
jgi:hypothetical protein